MALHEEDKARLRSFYLKTLQGQGSHASRVRWSDEHNQVARFRALSKIGDFEGASVLDVGCGLGDFYDFLKGEAGIKNVRYAGIDILAECITEARRTHPIECTFEVADISSFSKKEMFDYVLCSGGLSFKVVDNEEFYFSIIKKMFALSRIALGFNMLERHVHVDDETYAAYDPSHVVDFCQTLSPRLEIFTDYLEGDFTVFVCK